MLELQYIPLKSSAGQVAGHAFVRDGFLELRMRMRTTGSALVLTDKGSVTGRIGAGIALNGAVEAVAVVDGSKILFHGTPRGSKATTEDVRRRLLTMQQSSVSRNAKQDTETHTTQPVVKAEVSAEPVSAPVQDAPAPDRPRPRAIVARESAMLGETSRPFAAWEDEASLAAITRRAEEAFSRIERKSAEARAAISNVLEPTAFKEEIEENKVPPLAQRKKKARAVHAPDPASAAKEDGIEAILRRLGSDPVPDAPLTCIQGSAIHAEEYAAPSKEQESDSCEQTGDGWRALFQMEKRETPPVFAAPPLPRETPVPNPFPHIFPNASFIRVQDETLPYLSGTWQRGTEHFTITAVPGSYSPAPPAHLPEYNRFIRARSGGYWVLVREAQQ